MKIQNKAIIALFLALLGILGSIQLKVSGIISDDWALITLIVVSVLIGFIVLFFDRITHFSLSKLELTLQEVKETEASVKELGKAILAVVEASDHSLMLHSFDEKAYNEAIERLKKLSA